AADLQVAQRRDGVEILADGGPSALPDSLSVSLRTCGEVEILADGGPSALRWGDGTACASDSKLRSSPTADRQRCEDADRPPAAGGRVEILADGGPSALPEVARISKVVTVPLRSSPTADRRRCMEIALVSTIAKQQLRSSPTADRRRCTV